jgi:hypothetical protein
MNERIEKLANVWANLRAKDDRLGITYTFSEKALEKFAELIVRECIKESMEEIVADDEIAQEKDPLIREYLNGNNQGVVDAVVRFRNHFGVEE